MPPTLYARAWARLKADGVLLKADAQRPSVTTLAAGRPVAGSWWAHPKAHAIFAVLERLADHPDVLVAKLVDGKDTFVHRRLWPELLAKARAASRDGLSALERRILAAVEKAGALDASELSLPGVPAKARAAAVKALQARLLLHAEEYHSPSGAHRKRLESWEHWAQRRFRT